MGLTILINNFRYQKIAYPLTIFTSPIRFDSIRVFLNSKTLKWRDRQSFGFVVFNSVYLTTFTAAFSVLQEVHRRLLGLTTRIPNSLNIGPKHPPSQILDLQKARQIDTLFLSQTLHSVSLSNKRLT
jgi:hypothetical protein